MALSTQRAASRADDWRPPSRGRARRTATTGKKDSTLAVLREIRDEIRATNARLDSTNERLGHVELGLLDLAEQQRFVVRYLRAGSERDHRFEQDLAALRTRVEALEAARPR